MDGRFFTVESFFDNDFVAAFTERVAFEHIFYCGDGFSLRLCHDYTFTSS